MSFRLVPKSVTLNGEMALILRYFAEFGSFQNALRKLKVVNTAITMDNLRLLSSSKRLQRDARRPKYKYSITARWKFCSRFINSRLNAQYLPIAGYSYRLIC